MQTSNMEKTSGQMSNRELFERGLLITDEIKQLETNNLNIHAEIEVMDRTIRKYHDQAIEKAYLATDKGGNTKYTNESQRKIARRNFLRDSKPYKTVKDNLNSMKNTIKVNEIEINYRRYVLRLINSYMRQTPE